MEQTEEKQTEGEKLLNPLPQALPEVTSTAQLVKSLYLDDYGKPFELTPRQVEIFDWIFKKQYRRIHIMTHTQYGKSDVVALAVLTRASTFGEKWAIVAPTKEKAKIIMGYVIKHLFENEYTLSRFKIPEGENVERIRRERSANRLTFDVGGNQIGQIFILSAESRLKREEDIGNALMGYGAPNLVMDEASLVNDKSEAKAMRMVGAFTVGGDDFVAKIGNPFRRNHFLKSYEDELYQKINVNYEIGVAEGRLSSAFIEEMREKPFFRVLYENRFPEEGEIDEHGWTQLLSEEDIDRAKLKPGEEIKHAGERRLGNDIARGGLNYTTWILRSMNYASILAKSHQDNLTEIASQTLLFMNEQSVVPENTFIDDIGVGGGVVDPLKAQQLNVRGINVGTNALEQSRFANLRAEAYWRTREWVKRGGRLDNREEWYELCKIRYKPDHKGRIRVMSKDEMKMMGIDSPDVADALMLTFARGEHADLERRRILRGAKKRHRFDKGLHITQGGY